MAEHEDEIVGDHTRVFRSMSASGLRIAELMQRRREEVRRREADGQREAAQALRDRQTALRDAARTVAGQGLDPRWREAANDRELATAFVYAEAYRESDPLARIAHDQMSDYISARHGDIEAFVDSNVSQDDLTRVPVPEGTPSATQQRWAEAARAQDAVAESEAVASAAADTIDQAPREVASDLSGTEGDQSATANGRSAAETQASTPDAYIPVLDPEAVRRESEAAIARLLDPEAVRGVSIASEDAPVKRAPIALPANTLRENSAQRVAVLLGEGRDEDHTIHLIPAAGSGKESTVLDAQATARLLDADATIGDLVGDGTDKVVIVPDVSEYDARRRSSEMLAAADDATAGTWADIAHTFDRDYADKWLSGNMSEAQLAQVNKLRAWNEVEPKIAEGMDITEAMRELAEREKQLNADLDSNGIVGEVNERPAREARDEVQEQLGRRDQATARADELPITPEGLADLRKRDPEAAAAVSTSLAGRGRSVVGQLRSGNRSLGTEKKARSHAVRQDRGRDKDHGRAR